ncbi:BAG family molecular chaperone regulator 4-like [Impatiens glandulifera]|uniref:BAG family molecular chaperone regulator 4-like n=1 Tax=Impatiens glandulifera TaxID=253017 RepID=UPI001FB07F26|nr:BAG family molecular chaperone regulator 4-like [Impatiens glandulifera]
MKKFMRSKSWTNSLIRNRPCKTQPVVGGSGGKELKLRDSGGTGEVKWEVRPGGMIVQKRSEDHEMIRSMNNNKITVRVSSVNSQGDYWQDDITVSSTSTFGELKMAICMARGLIMDSNIKRIVYKGKEREDNEHVHMVGMTDKDKVFFLDHPSIN